VSRVRSGGGPEDAALVSFLAEVRAVGVLGADRLTSWPDRLLGIEVTRPELIAARPGVLIDLRAAPVLLVARADLGEAARPRIDDRPMALVDVVLDDLYAAWRPAGGVEVVAGRSRVAWSRPRLVEEIEQPLAAPPFVIDRVAPDRRWGAGAGVDAGVAAAHAGVYADLDALEARLRPDDPSRGGRLALALSGQLTPRAGLLEEGAARPTFGAGALARLREDGRARVDGALSAALEWRWLAALAEALVARDGGATELGGHAHARATFGRVTLAMRGELDGGGAGGGAWAAAAEIGWRVTRDGRNRIAVHAWLRRDRDRGTPFDGIVVFFQAHL
jgi:hypothetical protein